MKILRGNIEMALLWAVNSRQQYENDNGYDGNDSAMLATWKDALKGVETASLILIKD